ncbi:MAG: superfamily II helicase [Promethearchaeota archaeon CR_4]|nr:MAG: superfamily II helicase [Candidatus Lokiarchaeota archaeon CR_4]
MDIPPLIWNYLHTLGISELYAPQVKALREWMPGKNLILAIPTAAGKTLVAELIMVITILNQGNERRGKALYLTPLKALATEKYHSFKDHWVSFGLTITFSTGDFDHIDQALFSHDIIVMTNEKADSVLRTHPDLMQRITCIVVDEIHLLNDETRGVTLELVLTKIRKLTPTVQIIGLSATINNAGELASWLDAILIQDEWRPVKLKEGVFYDHKIAFADGSEKIFTYPIADPMELLLKDTVKGGGQVLAFLSTRRNAMVAAKKFTHVIEPLLSEEIRHHSLQVANDFENLETENSPQAHQLAGLLQFGVAFHHAGLTYAQRTFVENHFRQRNILAIAATPTLAAGINTPARRVIIKGLERFSMAKGNQEIPVIEYKQMAGRAGRPGFDPYGEAVIIARNPTHSDELMEKYVRGTPEDITSKLNNEAELKSHLLGTIASGFVRSWEEVIAFFNLSFFSFQNKMNLKQPTRKKAKITKDESIVSSGEDYSKYVRNYGDVGSYSIQKVVSREKKLEERLHDALSYLISEKMVQEGEGGALEVTLLGQKISQLYIKPESAVEFRATLRVISQRRAMHDIKLTTISFLHATSRFPDSYLPYVAETDKDGLCKFFQDHANEFVFPRKLRPTSSDLEYYFPELKLCAILFRWIRETPEERLASDLNVGSGDIRRFVETAEWLVHAAEVLCPSFHFTKWETGLKRLAIRLKYGCSEELVSLVSIYNIGRVRGRILFKAGYKTPDDVSRANDADLIKLPTFGPEIVTRIKQSLATGIMKIHIPRSESKLQTSNELDSNPRGKKPKKRGGTERALF